MVDAGMFTGISVGHSLQLSHLFYADDAVFIGNWSDTNIETIVHMLDCFYRASGLRINMNKSKLIGISVDKLKVDQAASKIGCASLQAPFSYLGLKVGGIMSRIQSCNEIVDKLSTRLSKWKMKTLSIGDRLTLLKSVLAKLSHDNISHSFRRVPRGGLEQFQLQELMDNIEGISLCESRDRWLWSLEGSGEFTVASVRKYIDERFLPEVSTKTR
ncbi:hypothetical protein Tco_0811756 [Tanacetum coccineum]